MARILVTGGKGMLGRDLARRWTSHELRTIDRGDCDIADARAIDDLVGAWKPEVVVHCAAMTQVDLCETQRDEAFRANAVGSANVAVACVRHGARLVAISTDYVFPGDADRPYTELDATGPRTVYGASKWAGEEAVRTHCPDHLIARIAWLYGPGGPSFVHTMMKLAAQEGPPVKVVDDQIGNPTSTAAVADGLARLIDARACGTVHLSCEGETSWFGFARAVFAARRSPRALQPCTTAEFPRPAPRPRNSRLEKMGLRLRGLPPMPAWQEALAGFFAAHPEG